MVFYFNNFKFIFDAKEKDSNITKNKILEVMEIFKLSHLKINGKSPVHLPPPSPKMGGDRTKVMYGFCSKDCGSGKKKEW